VRNNDWYAGMVEGAMDNVKWGLLCGGGTLATGVGAPVAAITGVIPILWGGIKGALGSGNKTLDCLRQADKDYENDKRRCMNQ